MGKKSKKKGGAANKAARKEKLLERREQQLEQLDQYSDDGGSNEIVDNRRDREYFVGDRVWFKGDVSYCRGDNPNTYRGIVHAVDEDFLEIKPLQALIDGVHYTQRIPRRTKPPEDKKYVFPDFCDLTLQFDLSDKVMCHNDGYWEPASVSYLWPIMELVEQRMPLPSNAADMVPHYKCNKVIADDYPAIAAPNDDSNFIRARPSLFRFKKGDSVTFNSSKARGNTAASSNYLQRNEGWTDGKIILVDVCEKYLDYAVYECSFKVGAKTYSCFINDDDDENIALIDESPRKRLFDAIEQDCSRDHFIYLARHFNIDVTVFRDLVLMKAIEFASYNALTWLQHDCGTDARTVMDKDGNNFLHMIANSPFAHRFIRRLGRNSYPRRTDDVQLELIDHGKVRTRELNNSGEMWLQCLVHSGDIKALDAVFSPHCGLACDHFICFDDVLERLAVTVGGSDDPMIQHIFDVFVSFRKIYEQWDTLKQSAYDKKTEEELLQNEHLVAFLGEGAIQCAKLLVRFYHDWQHILNETMIITPFQEIVMKGRFRLFQLLYEANQSFFENDKYYGTSKEDNQEFIQEELRTSTEDSNPRGIKVDIFYACILGSNHAPSFYSKYSSFDSYIRRVKDYFLRYTVAWGGDYPSSLYQYLSRINGEDKRGSYSTSNEYLEYKVTLLGDEGDVEGRQRILHYLLLQNKYVHLNILVPLIHRQCWALRFLVNEKYLDLERLAAEENTIVKSASTLSFLNSGKIPSKMAIRCCLSFVAVQYDDLQSLAWLCESFGPPNDIVEGWNLLHYSAFMGRIEIIGWLSTQPNWDSLVSRASSRKNFDGAFAVHIAASCGHLHACDLLIGLKVPLEDKKGKLPYDYAEKSQHEFVREWAARRAKPLALQKDVKKLVRLVEEQKSAKQIKDFILSSRCLDMKTWSSCDCDTSEEKLGDISFRDVIAFCCKHSDVEVVKWICLRLCFRSDADTYSYAEKAFWGMDFYAKDDTKLLQRDDLIVFVRERGYDDLEGYLSGKWFKDIMCSTMTSDHILEAVFSADERVVDVKAAILRISVLSKVAETSSKTIESILEKGGRVNELRELSRINTASTAVLRAEAGDIFDETNRTPYYWSPFEMTLEPLWGKHTVSKLLLYQRGEEKAGHGKHTILATEGYADLLHFCLANIKGWNATMELNVIRIASFFGHTSIVEMLLRPNNDFTLLSDKQDLHKAAILGAGEGVRYRDLEFLMQMSTENAIIDKGRGNESRIELGTIHDYFRSDLKRGVDFDDTTRMRMESLLVAVLHGYARDFYDPDVDSITMLKTLRLLVEKHVYTDGEVLYAMELLIPVLGYAGNEFLSCALNLLERVIDVLGIQPISHTAQMQAICKKVIESARKEIGEVGAVTSFFKRMVRAGIDVQVIDQEVYHYSKSDFGKSLKDLQQKQLRDWSRFDVVKKGKSLADIQQVITDGELTLDSRDRGGLLLTHLCAAYDRVDLLEWLVNEGMDLDAVDGQHRTALDVAKASKASMATKWILERKATVTIGSFVRRNYFHTMHKRRMQQSHEAATLIQSAVRAYTIRKLYANVLIQRMEESQQFTYVWGSVIASVGSASIAASTCWSDIREQLIDIKVGLDDEMLDDTHERLDRAVAEAITQEINETDDGICNELIEYDEPLVDGVTTIESTYNPDNSSQWLSFQMTSHVVKFLQQGDKKYRSFFVRRMAQLASGERSRILQKPLKGSKSIIYETYLEQKSGHRILWTEENDNIVIWYIAKHKQVSRLMQLIDDSKSRSARQQMPANLVSELQNEGLLSPDEPKKEVLLDIFGNVPLKIYDVNFNTINEITKESWTPQLHLTKEERGIVEAEGTVLVLGRSGTGKTVCICNRIECDRQSRAGCDPSFTQLFVARSVRLCRYVAGTVGEDNRTTFLTYTRLLSDIESTLPGHTRNFNPSQKMDFNRFKRDFHNHPSSNERASALTLWTVIRTFLKGSIEAFQSPDGVLPKDAFLEVERLGKNRCRIPAELRGQVYDEFLQYQKYLEEEQLWDDCDRVRHLLLRIKHSKEVDPDAVSEIQRSKVYVDEVQDYTQLEILLFFYLSGPNGLFLAGDPAQSVVEGTEFRFEEVRSVGHFVGSVMNKPKTVNINFRSHSGILNCAGGVLEFLFNHFPSSAKQLKKDSGLFQGARPGVLLGTSVDQLNILLSDKLKGAVVITHDECARHWRRLLHDYKLVYGIREAKGLEFKTVIILDFFREIPSPLQKPWRELVLGRATQDFELGHPLVATYLKLLYTGVTRCIEKLFFVETKSSTAGDASMRWLTQRALDRVSYATRNNVSDVEAMSMTSDEFISEGINNAELAQTMDELGEAQLLLDKSIWCFEQADIIELAAKARIHYSSISFRMEIQAPHDEKNANDRAVIEMRAAQLMESLTKEGLLFEVLNIFSSVTPFLSSYAEEELEKRFIRKIRLAAREQ